MSVKKRALSFGACMALTAMLVDSSNVAARSQQNMSSHDPVTVTLMTWETPATNALIDNAMATFMKLHPDIKVERLTTPASNYGQKLTSMIVAHKLPDLFWAGNDTEQQYGAQGLLYDWTSKANTASSGYNVKNFAPLSIANWSVKGHVYGLPSLMNTYGVWYNVADFKAAGLALPKVGWTYADMLHDAQVLATKMNRFGSALRPDRPARRSVFDRAILHVGRRCAVYQ